MFAVIRGWIGKELIFMNNLFIIDTYGINSREFQFWKIIFITVMFFYISIYEIEFIKLVSMISIDLKVLQWKF